MAAQEQHLKKAAALAYDYEADSRWSQYWTNVHIPSHLSSNPEAIRRHFQFKFYQRYIDPDLQVEPLSSISSTRNSGGASGSSMPGQQRPANSGERVRSARVNTQSSTQAAAATGGRLRLDSQTIQFLANALVVVMAFMAMLPFTPRALTDRSYRFAFLGTGIACAYCIYLQYGKPQAWNLQAIQVWLQSIVAAKDFLYLLYSLVFISAFMPIKFAVIPVLCRSIEYVARYLRRNFSGAQLYRKYLEDPCLWVETNNATLHILSANSEVGLGFLLLFFLLTPQRNLIQFLVYWQLLKLMYHAPTTASFHRNTWFRIGMSVNPLVHRYLPFLQGPLGFAQRWFHN